MWNFFFTQFMNYLVTGPILLDRWIDLANIKPDWSLFIVFINFTNLIMGKTAMLNAVPYVSHGFMETAPGLTFNIGTSY